MRPYSILLILILLFTQCNFLKKKENKEIVKEQQPKEKTREEIFAEEKAKQDSLDNAIFELLQKTPFGNLAFGMCKEEVDKSNEKRQLLGKYNYNFGYSFNQENQLYKVKIKSDGVKAIHFDTNLKYNYQNLYQIIKTKYGESATNRIFPSIFDVQNSKTLQMNRWETGTKQINIGLQENGMNSFSVICNIFDKNMAEMETQHLKNLKNKDVIEASEKF